MIPHRRLNFLLQFIRSPHHTCVPKRTALLCLLPAFLLKAGELPGAWTGDYSPCERHTQVLNRQRMELGVRFSTSNPGLAEQFARAMDFWAKIVEMDWHPDDSRKCAIQLVDGGPSLFKPAEAARAQFPEMLSFQGWIAFNPRISLPPGELFVTAVHELGHLLGLPHSSNSSSVMYFLCLDGPLFLDKNDLAVLAAHHKLRAGVGPVMVAPGGAATRGSGE